MQNNNRRLMWHGMFLFLLGLFTGFAETHFANVRMGLAAHLEGVMNGIFLLAVGAAWNELRLAPGLKSATFWIALYGAYMNWFFVVLAAIFGTGTLSPITATGRQGLPWQEKLITAGFMSVGLAIVACTLLLLWGFRAKAPISNS
ncbi:MAG: hydrogenase [Acidobacteria bacterium]|nr:hydrogenase [Acidobacteriota bacterium]